MYKHLFTILTIWATVSAYGQSLVESFAGKLTSNYVESLDFDPQGNLWVATDDGLNCFDGAEFVQHTKMSGDIPGDAINKVLADRMANRVWVATKRYGVGCFDYDTGDSFFLRHDDDAPNSIPGDEITGIRQDSNGDIWFSFFRGGLAKYDTATERLTCFTPENTPGMRNVPAHDFIIGQDGRIYIATYSQGMAILNPETRAIQYFTHDASNPNSLPSNEIRDAYLDRDGNVWMGTNRGIALFRPITGDFTIFDQKNSCLPDGLVFTLLRTSDDRLLVAVEMKGVWEYDLKSPAKGQKFRLLKETEEMPSLTIYDMQEDRFGNIWLGAYGGGLLFIGRNKPVFNNLSYPDKLPERIVRGLFFNDEDNMLAATEGGGTVLFDNEFKPLRGSSMRESDNISLYVDSRGNSWVGSLNGHVSVLDPQLCVKSTIPVMAARAFYESGDTMWITSGTSGLFAVDKQTFTILHRYSRGFLPDGYMRTVSEDNNHNLWVGSFRSGLFIFNRDMSGYTNLSTHTGFPSDGINHIMKDQEGNMWVSSGNGLIMFKGSNPENWERVGIETFGLSSENIKASVVAQDGSVWFSTTSSICRLDKDGKITEYGKRYGISGGDFIEGAVAVRADGLMAFGSTSGITYFSPDRVTGAATAAPVHFSRLLIFNTSDPITEESSEVYLPGKDKVVLTHHQNNIRVTFAVDDYSLSADAEYSYKIDGFDNNWYVSYGNSLSLYNIPPGHYTLVVRARLLEGEWSEEIDSIGLTVKPPFYATKLAYALYVLMFLTFALVLISLILSRQYARASLRETQELNEEKLRFYSNITHELKTPLSLILGPAEDVMKDQSLNKETKRRAELIYKNTTKILDLINQLLNFRKMETRGVAFNPTYGDLSSFVREIGNVFAESRINRNVSFKTEIVDGVFTEFDHEILTTILNNLLSNALKYTYCGNVTLGLNLVGEGDGRVVEITVSDTGIGIRKDNIDKIFERYYQEPDKHQASGVGIGLSLVKSFAEIHSGSIGVESEKGKGSIFTFRFPYKAHEVLPVSNEVVSETHLPSILVADDNDDITDYIKSTLSGTYLVYTAQNGTVAYSLAAKFVPDVIVSDVMMPEMDGIEFCKKVKQDVRISHIPIILLTAKDTICDRQEGYEAGADSYITKPFTSEILKVRIQNLLESRRKLANQYMHSILNQKAAYGNSSSFSEIDKAFIDKITDYIECNLSSEDLDIEALASNVGMSLSSFYRKMKGLVGISAIEYIRKIKMRKAAEMLASGNFNVSETAWSVGISSIAYFRQCFKSEYGITPSEFRKKSV